MYTDDQIKQFIGDKGINDNPYAIYNYAKQFGVAPGRIDSVMGYQPGTSDNWIKQQGLQGLAGSAVGGTRATTGNYTDDQVRQFTEPPQFGVLGEARVNVLLLNRALERRTDHERRGLDWESSARAVGMSAR